MTAERNKSENVFVSFLFRKTEEMCYLSLCKKQRSEAEPPAMRLRPSSFRVVSSSV